MAKAMHDGPGRESGQAYELEIFEDDASASLHRHPSDGVASAAVEEQYEHSGLITPLPKVQLAVLCAVRVVDPISFTSIFPYVNELVDSLHLTNDPGRTGFYSGLVESTFAISQLFSIYHWARLSDTVGRRPVIIWGILGMSLTTILFLGLSRTLIGVLMARFLTGLFAGNTAVVHSVLCEMTDSSNQAAAFPIYGLVWPIGAIIGPLIGGTFANPAQKFPALFDNAFFREYPYFLPCFMAGIIALGGATLGYFFLEETLPSKRRRSEKYADLEPPAPPPSIMALLSIPVIRALCLSGSCLAFIATAFDVVFVLFCYSPIKTGGLAFSASEIGYTLALSGIISILIQLFVMPYLLRNFPSTRIYSVCMAIWPCAFISLPVLNALARMGELPVAELLSGVAESAEMLMEGAVEAMAEAGMAEAAAATKTPGAAALVWFGVLVVLAVSRVACIAYSVNMILVKENAPSPTSLGTTNGLVQVSMCFARAFSPAFVSSAFALSVDNHLLGGHMWVAIMVVISFLGSSVANRIGNHVPDRRPRFRRS